MRASTDPTAATSERYRAFAEVEARGMSACYEEWASGVAGDSSIIALIDRLPAPKRQPNLVFTSARFCGAEVSGFSEFADWLRSHWAEVESTCLSHATQTNEPGRCALLLPALAELPEPLALIEVGASAGLCLYPDRYSYRYLNETDGTLDVRGAAERTLDPASGRSDVVLDCLISGPVPLPSRLPDVVWRGGVDLNPLDVSRPSDVDWLDALIWPEHDDRRARLHAAVGVARRDPVDIVRGDLVAEVEGLVNRAPDDTSVVVFHTAVLSYLDEAARRQFVGLMDRLPVTWLASEAQRVVPGVMDRVEARGIALPISSDFVVSRDGDPIAFAQPHGRALHWLGAELVRG